MASANLLEFGNNAIEGTEQRKVIVVGPSAAGKTAICRWCQTGATCGNKYIPTTTNVDYNKVLVRLPKSMMGPPSTSSENNLKSPPSASPCPSAREVKEEQLLAAQAGGSGGSDRSVMLQLWSTAGQDRVLMDIQRLFYRNASACVVIADALSVFKAYDEVTGDKKAEISKVQGSSLSEIERAVTGTSAETGPTAGRAERPVHTTPKEAFKLAVKWKDQAKKASPDLPFVLLINKMDLFVNQSKSSSSPQLKPHSRTTSGLSDKQSPSTFRRSSSDVDGNFQKSAASSLPFSEKELDAFCEEEGFAAYYCTSAKTGDGLAEAMQCAAAVAVGSVAPLKTAQCQGPAAKKVALIHTRPPTKEKTEKAGCPCKN